MAKKKPKKPKLKIINVLPRVIIVGFFALLFWTTSSGIRSAQPYPYKTWQMGDIVKDQKLEFTTDKITEDDMGAPGFWAPAKDEKFLMVSMSFKNKTGAVYHLSPISFMKLRDSDNHEYPVSSGPRITKGLGGPVNDGETMSGQVGFLVKKSAKDLKLIFDPRIINENIIVVSL